MHPKQSRRLFPALLFAAPRSSPQELKSSSATKVTEGVETVLKWSKVGFSKTGTRHPTLIIAVEFKTRIKWDYYRSSWTCEDLRLLLLCWCVSGRLENGGCNSWSNWTQQRSFGTQMLQKRTSRLLPDQSETSVLSIQDGDNDYVGMGWILGWYSGCVNILYMSIHEKQNGAFMFSSCLPLRSRLSFWCWWIKAQTGNRIQRKDTQGLPYIVEQLSTPLIHLIRFSQLSFFFFLPFREYRGFKFATACPSWHSEPGASPSISAKRGKKN